MSISYDQSEQTVKAENSIPLDSQSGAPTVALHTFEDDTIQQLMSKPVKDGINYMVSVINAAYKQIPVDTANDLGPLQTIFTYMKDTGLTLERYSFMGSRSGEKKFKDESGVEFLFGEIEDAPVLQISSANKEEWECWLGEEKGNHYVGVMSPNTVEGWSEYPGEGMDEGKLVAQFTDVQGQTMNVEPLLLSCKSLQPLSKPHKSGLPQGA